MKPDGLLERLALRLNLAPVPAVEAMFGMMSSRAVMAGQRLGIFRELAGGAMSVESLAGQLQLDGHGVGHLLESLEALGHIKRQPNGDYFITERSRKWLDPASPTYVGTCIEGNFVQWDWWSNLEDVMRTGQGFDMHSIPEDDPRWRTYITAMFELARLSAPEVASRIKLRNPKQILDLAGGHGWFAAEICRRYPGCSAVVIDLPGSTQIGRDIIAANGLSDRVIHVEGNILTDDLGGQFDAVFAFQIIHHLSEDQNRALFQRVSTALKPGATFAILDYFASPPNKHPDFDALLGLHFYLTSTATTYTQGMVELWLRERQFNQIHASRLRRMPVQSLILAKRS